MLQSEKELLNTTLTLYAEGGEIRTVLAPELIGTDTQIELAETNLQAEGLLT